MQLEEDFDKTEYEWDSTTTPDGVYQFKVVASDRKDNADAEALTGEKTSSPFVVCHTPPAVQVKAKVDGGQAAIEATAVVAAGAADGGLVHAQRQEVGERLPGGRPVRRPGEDVPLPDGRV